ncbi:MAG: hypothetical protein HY063_04915 [Bacteroidetes bacterium]|nr:hypothetical protein [Bacteroidota bacterium]
MKKHEPIGEKREGKVINKVQGIIQDSFTKGNIKATNPGNIPINDNDTVTYISYVSNFNGGQKIVHVIKDKKSH